MSICLNKLCGRERFCKGLCRRCYGKKQYRNGNGTTYYNSLRAKEYNSRPEVKAKRKAYAQLPSVKSKKRESAKRGRKKNRDCLKVKRGMRLLPQLFGLTRKGELAKERTKYAKDYNRELRLARIIQLGGECVKCGYCKSMAALDLHHITKLPVKTKNGQRNNWDTKSKKVDANEFMLLCANCHRELHRPGLELKELKKKYA